MITSKGHKVRYTNGIIKAKGDQEADITINGQVINNGNVEFYLRNDGRAGLKTNGKVVEDVYLTIEKDEAGRFQSVTGALLYTNSLVWDEKVSRTSKILDIYGRVIKKNRTRISDNRSLSNS
jgi:hypothetical protein